MYFAKKKKKKRGFTLIELLVVIAIIGILATIVIVNVNTARNKAKDAVVKADIEGIRNVAEMYYTSNNTYLAVDTADADWTRLEAAVNVAAGAGAFTHCTITASTWCARSTLPGGGSTCADYTGYAGAPTLVGDCAAADCTCQ